MVDADPNIAMLDLQEVAAQRSEAANYRFRQRVAGRWAEQILEKVGVKDHRLLTRELGHGQSNKSPVHQSVCQSVADHYTSVDIPLGTRKESRPEYRRHFGDQKTGARIRSNRVYEEVFDVLPFGIGGHIDRKKLGGYQQYAVETFWVFARDENDPLREEHSDGIATSTRWEDPLNLEKPDDAYERNPEAADRRFDAFVGDILRIAKAAEVELVSPGSVYAYDL
jgi:hypothetical protein